MKLNTFINALKIMQKNIKKYNPPVYKLEKTSKQTPFKMLVSASLSSRTKDETTIKVIKRLFSKLIPSLNNFKHQHPSDKHRFNIKTANKSKTVPRPAIRNTIYEKMLTFLFKARNETFELLPVIIPGGCPVRGLGMIKKETGDFEAQIVVHNRGQVLD